MHALMAVVQLRVAGSDTGLTVQTGPVQKKAGFFHFGEQTGRQ
jgi:hypothetical protein